VNLAHVIAAVEFVASEFAESPDEINVPAGSDVLPELAQTGPEADAIARVAE
jgi:hypothetical protein